MADTFRKEYKELSEGQKLWMNKIKETAEILESMYNDINTPDMGREIALAKTKLEESVMWAVKGLTK
ncbi:MAG: hypothetical protein IFNCLDLE_02632 [Ignavibacteriaceae bacterium]|nr:hypothetical protein [Ignavibacteriaceae bacterium]